MKAKLLWLCIVLAVVWGMKRYYSTAADLDWVLAPTARVTTTITGVRFDAEQGAGYLARDRLFAIEKACAGVNFMIAAFAMMAFVLRRRVRSVGSGAVVLAACLITAYASGVVVNATRIATALWLPHSFGAQTHRLEGITVYFVGLVMLHEIVRRVEA